VRTPTTTLHPPDDQALRDIPRLADRYVRSRTLVIVPMMLVFVAAWAVIAGLSWLSGRAYFTHSAAFPFLAAAAIASCATWVWATVSGRLARLEGTFRRMYAADGEAVPTATPAQSMRGMRTAAILFGSAIALTVLSGFIINWPERLMQPISAIYSVPFLVYLCYKQGGFAAPLMLLWPVLYAIHAALVLADVPLGFLEWPPLSVLAPMALYGIIAAVASHIHGRFILRRLRSLASTGAGHAAGEESR
jgi:hypothetical protein